MDRDASAGEIFTGFFSFNLEKRENKNILNVTVDMNRSFMTTTVNV